MDLSLLRELGSWQWALGLSASVLIGLSRTVYSGLALIFIPLMVSAFGARTSLGLILPLLCFGDLLAIARYRVHADVRSLVALAPWTLVGMAIGLAVGRDLPDDLFRNAIAGVVAVCIVLMILQERRRPFARGPVPGWLPAVSGIAAGIATMIGNAAGPIMTIYLLSMDKGKNAFIGTTAWFFFAVNLLKLPLQAFFWGTIDGASLVVDLVLAPFVALGAFAGVAIASRIPERGFRFMVYVVSVLSAAILLAG